MPHIIEVRHQIYRIKDAAQWLSCIYSAFAHLVDSIAVAEQLRRKPSEFDLIVSKTGIIGGLRAGYYGAVLHERVDGTQYRKRHVVAIGIQAQDLVFHATLGHDPPVCNAQLVHQGIRIDVIECVASWDMRSLALEDRCQVRVFSIEVQKVSAKMS